jgi:hypothetical protein
MTPHMRPGPAGDQRAMPQYDHLPCTDAQTRNISCAASLKPPEFTSGLTAAPADSMHRHRRVEGGHRSPKTRPKAPAGQRALAGTLYKTRRVPPPSPGRPSNPPPANQVEASRRWCGLPEGSIRRQEGNQRVIFVADDEVVWLMALGTVDIALTGRKTRFLRTPCGLAGGPDALNREPRPANC